MLILARAVTLGNREMKKGIVLTLGRLSLGFSLRLTLDWVAFIVLFLRVPTEFINQPLALLPMKRQLLHGHAHLLILKFTKNVLLETGVPKKGFIVGFT